MKRNITCMLFMLNLWAAAETRHLNLQRALDLKLVKAIAKSLGGYQGLCIQMELKNLGADTLVIMVEAGRRLKSTDSQQQDILITHQEIIVLRKFESRSFGIKGYCCQANNHAPLKGSNYSINKMADCNLVKLAMYLNSYKNDQDVEQQAIWAVSDNRPVSMISSSKDTVVSGLKSFVCVIKGAVVPWYSLITKTHVYENGVMQTWPIWLRGKLVYDNTEACYTTLHVLDEKGMEVCQIIQQWSYPGAAQTYNLNIPVKGLAKGKYTIELKNREKQLARREFEI
jgi:hypothetical protein